MSDISNHWQPALLLTTMLLSACNAHSPESSVIGNTNATEQALSPPPCANNTCGVRTDVVTIPQCENLHFDQTGRLFATGVNIYEVFNNNGNFSTNIVDTGGCLFEFTGLALRDDVLYSPCIDTTQLYAGRVTANPQLSPIYNFALSTRGPNGMAADSDGNLYVVDGPVRPPPGKIVKLRFDPNDPFTVISEEDWLTTGIEFPNGIAFDGQDFYITDSDPSGGQQGSIKRVPLLPDGSAGAPETVYVHDGVLDDLSLTSGNLILASDFSQGRFIVVDYQGNLVDATDPLTWANVADVERGQAPLFNSDDILICDKGPFMPNGPTGNVLSRFGAP